MNLVSNDTNLVFYLSVYKLIREDWVADAVGNVSGNSCVSDCRTRGRDFDPSWSHTFLEIDHEIISTVILLPSAVSFKKSCCQLQAKVCAKVLVNCLPRKKVWLGELTILP